LNDHIWHGNRGIGEGRVLGGHYCPQPKDLDPQRSQIFLEIPPYAHTFGPSDLFAAANRLVVCIIDVKKRFLRFFYSGHVFYVFNDFFIFFPTFFIFNKVH